MKYIIFTALFACVWATGKKNIDNNELLFLQQNANLLLQDISFFRNKVDRESENKDDKFKNFWEREKEHLQFPYGELVKELSAKGTSSKLKQKIDELLGSFKAIADRMELPNFDENKNAWQEVSDYLSKIYEIVDTISKNLNNEIVQAEAR